MEIFVSKRSVSANASARYTNVQDMNVRLNMNLLWSLLFVTSLHVRMLLMHHFMSDHQPVTYFYVIVHLALALMGLQPTDASPFMLPHK